MCQERLNDWNETHKTAFSLKEDCSEKLVGGYSDRNIDGKLTVNETVKSPVISTCLTVDCQLCC
jgi:hypothetical protein